MLTCCNLLCGAVATYMATQERFLLAFMLIILAAVFDFLDGFVARLLRVSSPIGKELDSLADDITFGLAPATMLCVLLRPALGWWSLLAFLMAAASALRLAKFNVDERQTSSFIGLATPANAIFWGALVAVMAPMTPVVLNPPFAWVYLGLSLVSCWLLNAEIPFFSLKFHGFAWKQHRLQYIFLIVSLLFVLLFGAMAWVAHNVILLVFAGAVCVAWYVVLNLFVFILKGYVTTNG